MNLGVFLEIKKASYDYYMGGYKNLTREKVVDLKIKSHKDYKSEEDREDVYRDLLETELFKIDEGYFKNYGYYCTWYDVRRCIHDEPISTNYDAFKTRENDDGEIVHINRDGYEIDEEFMDEEYLDDVRSFYDDLVEKIETSKFNKISLDDVEDREDLVLIDSKDVGDCVVDYYGLYFTKKHNTYIFTHSNNYFEDSSDYRDESEVFESETPVKTVDEARESLYSEEECYC